MAGFTATRRGFAPGHSERLTLRQLPPSTVTDGSRFNVVSNGAKGDFTADDTTPFLTSITQAQANGGGTVFAPAGHYKVTSQLAVTASFVEIRLAPGANLDFSTASIGTLNNWVPSINFVGSDQTPVALTNDVAAGDEFVRVAPGSEPVDATRIRLWSLGFWGPGPDTPAAPPIDTPGSVAKRGEHKLVSMPAGTLSVQLNPADTTLTIDNTLNDARVGSRWPANASVRIDSEDIPYTTVSVTTSSVVLGGLTRGGGATTHLVNAGVALTPGYVGLKTAADDSYLTSDTATITPESMLLNVGITGAGTITGPGFGKGANALNLDRCAHVLSSPHLRFVNWDRAAIYLTDTIESTFFAPMIIGGKSNSSEFYGVAPQWAAQDLTIIGGHVQDCRHAFTTTGSKAKSGISRRVKVIGMHAVATTSHSFDTHPPGEDISFVDCTSEFSADCGFSMRAPSVKILGGHVKLCAGHGVRLRNESLMPTRWTVDGVSIQSPADIGLTIRPDGTVTTLQTTITAGQAAPFTIQVASTSAWDASTNLIYITGEWFTATVQDSTHFSVTARAQAGSTAVGHAINDQVQSPLVTTGQTIDYILVDNLAVQDAGWGGKSVPSLEVQSQDNLPVTNVRFGTVHIKSQEKSVGASTAGVYFNNVTDSSIERLVIQNHPAAGIGVALSNATNVKINQPAVRFASRSTGKALQLVGAAACEVAFPQSTNAGTGISIDGTSSATRLRAIEGINEATTPFSDATTSTIYDPTVAASRAFGTATLAAGTSGSIANAAITATSLIRLTNIGVGGTVGVLSVALAAGVGFTVNSSSNTDTSKVFWEIVRF